MGLIERRLAEECDKRHLHAHDFDLLMRHIENNHAATYGALKDSNDTLRRRLEGAVEALERIADGYPGESRDVAVVDGWYRAQADTALGNLKRGQ